MRIQRPLKREGINDVGKTVCPHEKEWKWTFTLHHIKINSKWTEDINERHKTPKRNNGEKTSRH